MKRLIFFALFLVAVAATGWAAWADKYVTATAGGGGDGSSGTPWTLAEAIAAAAGSDRVNVKVGTYTLAADATFATAGTTTAPIWWRGYTTTIGDLDAAGGARVVGTNLPRIDADTATDQVVISGAYQIFSNIGVTSICTDSGGAVNVTGGNIRLIRCNIDNTAANSNSRALSTATGASVEVIGCRLKATTTATFAVSNSVATAITGCHIIGGATGLTLASSNRVAYTVIESFATNGMTCTSATGFIQLSNLTIYAAATNGILVSTIPTSGAIKIENTIIGGCTNGVNNNTGGNTNGITMLKVHFYNCTNNLVGITEIAAVTDDLGAALFLVDNDTDPFVNKAANDFSLVAGATTDKSTGYPGLFEGQTAMTGYPDIGAVRHVDPSGAGQTSHSY